MDVRSRITVTIILFAALERDCADIQTNNAVLNSGSYAIYRPGCEVCLSYCNTNSQNFSLPSQQIVHLKHHVIYVLWAEVNQLIIKVMEIIKFEVGQ